jgi:hypothetical protein
LGHIFKGDVDFRPVRSVTPGPFPNTLPTASAQLGSVGDARIFSPYCFAKWRGKKEVVSKL